MNNLFLKGHIVRDAQVQFIGQNNIPCLKFTLALNRKTKDGNGGFNKQPMFFDAVLWGNYAQKINRISKGMLVFLEGRLSQESYEYKGKKQSRITIQARHITLFDKKDKLQNKQNSIEPNTTAPAQNARIDADFMSDFCSMNK